MELDQVANAEACPITQVRAFQLHFVLNEQGKLILEALGEGTEEEIVSLAYPVLDQALSDAYGDGVYDSYEALPPDRRAAIATAVEAERSRIAGDRTQTAAPLTALGRDLKNQTDIPTILVDRIVRHVATTKLKEFRGRGNPCCYGRSRLVRGAHEQWPLGVSWSASGSRREEGPFRCVLWRMQRTPRRAGYLQTNHCERPAIARPSSDLTAVWSERGS